MPTVKLFGNLRRDANASELFISGDTVRAVLQSLCAENAALSSAIFDGDHLRVHLRVLVNGHDIELAQGLDTRVEAQDQITIFPPIAGGRCLPTVDGSQRSVVGGRLRISKDKDSKCTVGLEEF